MPRLSTLTHQPERVSSADQQPTDGQQHGSRRRFGLGSVSRLGLGLVASVACLILLASEVRIAGVQDTMQRMDYGLLGLAMVVTLLIMVFKAARWRSLYPAPTRPSLRLAIAGIAMGQVANWAVPARLGELIRMGLVSIDSKEGAANSRASLALSAGVLGAEKLCEGTMLLVTVALLFLLVGVPFAISSVGLLSTAGFCILGIAALVGWRLELFRLSLPAWLLERVHQRIRMASLAAHARAFSEGLMSWASPAGLAQATLWSVGIWVLGGLTNAVVMSSLGLPSSLGASFTLLAALYGAAVIPSVPGRIGVFQYVCVVVLVPFGIEFDDAVAFALALYAVVYLPPLVIGALSVMLIWPQTQRTVGGLGELQTRLGRVVRSAPRPARPDIAPPLPEQG
jgi:uncharacterized membrane protein YbhN (UPF0104 family)